MNKHVTLWDDDRKVLMFFCPGCRCGHGVWTSKDHPNKITGATWTWNGDRVKPTVTPSILLNKPRCHSYVTDGRIQFLPDCDHALAGQTVDLPPF